LTTREIAVESPLGKLRLVAAHGALIGIWFPGQPGAPPPGPAGTGGDPVLEEARAQLDEYFAGRRRAFELPLAPRGTAFQRAVWTGLLDIPFGETRTYGALARAVGRPSAARAVGAANGANPLSIVVPCHRVVGAEGSLTGYAGGEERKRWLLRHEGIGAEEGLVPDVIPLKGLASQPPQRADDDSGRVVKASRESDRPSSPTAGQEPAGRKFRRTPARPRVGNQRCRRRPHCVRAVPSGERVDQAGGGGERPQASRREATQESEPTKGPST